MKAVRISHARRLLAPATPADRHALRDKLANLDGDEKVVSCLLALAAARLDLERERALGPGSCLVPGHTGLSKIVRNEKGWFRHVCNCETADGELLLGVVDVFASTAAGRLVRLSKPLLPRWRGRALAEIGYLTLPAVPLARLPRRAPGSAHVLWEGVALLLAVEEVIGDDPSRPFPFSYQFACDWCGGMAHSTVVGARRWLEQNGFLIVERQVATPPFRYETRYYSGQRARTGPAAPPRLDRSERLDADPASTLETLAAAEAEASTVPETDATTTRQLVARAEVESSCENAEGGKSLRPLIEQARQAAGRATASSSTGQGRLWSEDEER